MKVTRCDRCGSICEDNTYVTIKIIKSINNQWDYDLCEKCEKKLEEFLKMIKTEKQKICEIVKKQNKVKRRIIIDLPMDTEQMIRELRYLENKYKEYTYSTFETNWYCLCHDVADRLEELNEELKALKK